MNNAAVIMGLLSIGSSNVPGVVLPQPMPLPRPPEPIAPKPADLSAQRRAAAVAKRERRKARRLTGGAR